MVQKKVTLSMADTTLAQARAAAASRGIPLSTWVDRAARAQARREAAATYDQWLAENPDVTADVAAFRALTTTATTRSWSAALTAANDTSAAAE